MNGCFNRDPFKESMKVQDGWIDYGSSRMPKINGIKAGTRWKDYTNPFSALIASNDNQSKRFA